MPDQAVIARQYFRPLALIEIDEQRPVRMAAHAILVTQHAMVIVEIVEDAADMGRQFRRCEGADQRLRLLFDCVAYVRCRHLRVVAELHSGSCSGR